MHSVSTNADRTIAYLAHQTGGLALADLTQSPPQIVGAPLHLPGLAPHSAVQAPGRSLLVVTEAVDPMPYGAGCPWGHLRTVDTGDASAPAVVGEYALPEQDPAQCASVPPLTALTAHNATVTHDRALVTWYAGDLPAIDISDPAQPFQLAELRREALPHVTTEHPRLDGSKVEMWSYPIIDDGLIDVVDVRNGLYVLGNHGRGGEQVLATKFAEGNSTRTLR